MRNYSPLIGIIALAACSAAGPPTLRREGPVTASLQACSSVGTVKNDVRSCIGRSIQIEAYLVSTHHGAYLVDSPEGSDALGVNFTESKARRNPLSDLEKKLIEARLGNPYGQIHGVFEGRLMIMPDRNDPTFIIDKEVQ